MTCRNSENQFDLWWALFQCQPRDVDCGERNCCSDPELPVPGHEEQWGHEECITTNRSSYLGRMVKPALGCDFFRTIVDRHVVKHLSLILDHLALSIEHLRILLKLRWKSGHMSPNVELTGAAHNQPTASGEREWLRKHRKPRRPRAQRPG